MDNVENPPKKRRSARAQKTAKVIILSISMFFVAGVSENLGKEILNKFKYPLTLSFVHLISSSVYSIPLLYFMDLKNFPVNSQQFLGIVLPMAIIKTFSVAAGHFSIYKISVAYSQIIKACLPIFTVVLGVLFFKFRSNARIFLSLIIMVAGIVIASFTEATFSSIGLILGLASTMGQSIQHLVNNRLMNESQVHSFELLAFYSRLSLFMLTPVWIFKDAKSIFCLVNASSFRISTNWQIAMLLAADGFLNFLEGVFAFLLLKVVTAPSYAVIGASKRVMAILISFVWFNVDVTLANLLGISTAICGVFLYSYFRFKDNAPKPPAKTPRSSRAQNANTDTDINQDQNSQEMIQMKPEEKEKLLNGNHMVMDSNSNLSSKKEQGWSGPTIIYMVLEAL